MMNFREIPTRLSPFVLKTIARIILSKSLSLFY